MNLSADMETPVPTTIEQILDLARWAPSGDNTQPWRFEIIDEYHVVVHGFDTRDHCVYDLDGHPSQIALGALLETMAIAASRHQLRMDVCRRVDAPEATPIFDVHFVPDPATEADPLIDYIQSRCVQRRPMSPRPLTPAEKQALEASIGSMYRVLWLEGFQTKLLTARLMFNNAKLRLTMPEAYQVHREIIQWKARYSNDRVPDQALGVDAVTVGVMRWVMTSWKRVDFFNRFLAGTWAPRIQMDFIPSIACAAHFVICALYKPATTDDYVSAGRAVQRFWLTVTRLGLFMQPEMTPLIFSRYIREHTPFSQTPSMNEQGARVAREFSALAGEECSTTAVFMGRVGTGNHPRARSLRRPLPELLLPPATKP